MLRTGLKWVARGAAVAMALALATTGEAAEPKGEILIVAPLLRQHFDPTTMIATTDYLVNDILFDGLLNNGPNGKYPALATNWKISPDGKQFDFELRKGVKFHNGDPFTAEDVKFTYEQLLKPDNTHSYRKGFVDAIQRIEVIDPLHVRFILKTPWLGFFSTSRYALQPIVPKHYYEKVGPKGFQDKPVGTGPFKLDSIIAGEWNRFAANRDYWDGSPHVKYVKQQLVKEPFTRYAMLQKGEADIVAGLTGPLLDKIRENKDVRVFTAKFSGTSALFFNVAKFPEAKDERVRQAIGYAIDRNAIAKNVLRGVCQPSDEVFTPATFGFLPGLKSIPYDPAKAKALLKEAGIAPGKELTFTIHTESASLPNAPQVLEAIAGYLEAAGLKIVREPYDMAAWMSMMRGGKQPAVFYGTSAMPDDGGELISGWYNSKAVWSSGNINDPDYDKVLADQFQMTDPKARLALLQNFAKLEDARRESVPLFWCGESFAVSNRVKDLKPAIGSPYHLKLQTVELAK
ncbi:MAG: ABC transporter substrate-binding protein [Rhodospirillales bacterium]